MSNPSDRPTPLTDREKKARSYSSVRRNGQQYYAEILDKYVNNVQESNKIMQEGKKVDKGKMTAAIKVWMDKTKEQKEKEQKLREKGEEITLLKRLELKLNKVNSEHED